MKVYLKVHNIDENVTVACCDEQLLNQVFREGNLRIEISTQFFGGKLIDLESAINVLKEVPFFNIVGENIIEKAIICNLLPREGVKIINGVPMAIKMMI
ncbi:MAG: DUF424 domain-containing protein [Promethearchaeota archaeon]|jgi:hypothetical protein